MKNIFVTIIFIIIFFIIPFSTFAADIEISCNGKDCFPSSIPKLFSETDLWYPGIWKSKIVTIRNLDDKENLEIANRISQLSFDNNSCEFDKKVMLSISQSNDKSFNTIWSGSLYDLYHVLNPIKLATIEPSAVTDIKYIASFDQTSGNECQGNILTFDLQLNFLSIKIPKSNNNKNQNSLPNNECLDIKPNSAPTLTSAIPGENSVTLIWEKPTSTKITYYYLLYGTSNDHKALSNPNIGITNNIYTVTGLNKLEPYYFTLKTGNGCAIGPESNELSAVPIISNTSIKNKNEEKVLGISTSISNTPKISPIKKLLNNNIINYSILVSLLIMLIIIFI
ncbi:MAG: fibronectin type III domain-containing protein [bacterium]|nr:fibronectin type III domain-containing protein [bacterium]